MNSLEAELNEKKDQLKIDEKEHKESVVNRLSNSLITKYKNKKSIIEIFNEKHADVAFDDKTKLFSLKNFKYKEESLNFNVSMKLKKNRFLDRLDFTLFNHLDRSVNSRSNRYF